MEASEKKVVTIPRSRKQKEQDTLASAAKIFVRDGFEKAHMDEIAKNANVSKQTIYSNFGSKENLFNEIVSDIFKDLQNENIQKPETECPVEILQIFLERLMIPLFSKKGIALYRLAISEGPSNPKLNQIFISRMERGITRLAALLEQMNSSGIIHIVNTQGAAQNLIYQCKGLQHSKLLCGYEKSITKEEVSFLVKKQALSFLKCHNFKIPKK